MRARRFFGVVLIAGLLSCGITTAQTDTNKPLSEIGFRKEQLPGFDSQRWAIGVLVALAVGAGALWWLRQRTSGALPNLLQGLIPTARRMKLVESLRVSPRTSLLLVEVDGRTILLGEHAAGLVLLSPPVEPKHDE